VAELTGRLEGIGLVPLVQFLTSVAGNGRLIVRDAELSGRLDIEDGVLVGAVFEHEQGTPALEAIALALANGRFDFREANGPIDHNLRLSADQLSEVLDRLNREQVALRAAVPSLSAVPHLMLGEGSDDRQVSIDRDTLRLLTRLDGRRTVAELARERGLLRTLRQVAQLVQLTLVQVDPLAVAHATAAPPEAPVTRSEMDRPTEDKAAAPQPAPGARGRPTTPEPAWSRWRRPTDHT
jgi:Domain of unknown function (DUF4388)